LQGVLAHPELVRAWDCRLEIPCFCEAQPFEEGVELDRGVIYEDELQGGHEGYLSQIVREAAKGKGNHHLHRQVRPHIW
jgi:hypothetical protein